MEFLHPSTPAREIFKEDASIAFTDTGQAFIFCPARPDAVPLSAWLKNPLPHASHSEVDNSRGGHIFMVPTRPTDGVLEVEKEQMAQIATLWNIPAAASRHLLRSEGFGSFEQTVDGIVYRWYGLPVSLSRELTVALRIVSCVGKPRKGGADVLNTIIVCPKNILPLVGNCVRLYREKVNVELPLPLQPLTLLVYLVGTALDSWSSHLVGMVAVGQLHVSDGSLNA